MIVDPHRERYDRQIRAERLVTGDQLHLTVMGGDEYFEVTEVRRVGSTIYWKATGVANLQDTVPCDSLVWVKK